MNTDVTPDASIAGASSTGASITSDAITDDAPAGGQPSAIARALNFIARLNTLVSGLCLVTLIAIFGWLVFGRYVLNSTPTWAEQLGLLLIVYITFLSAAVGIHDETHLSVELFREMLPPRLRKLLFIISDLLLVTFGVLMATQAWVLVQFGWSTKIPLLGIPEGIKSFAMVIGGTLIALFAGARVVRRMLTPLPIMPSAHPDKATNKE